MLFFVIYFITWLKYWIYLMRIIQQHILLTGWKLRSTWAACFFQSLLKQLALSTHPLIVISLHVWSNFPSLPNCSCPLMLATVSLRLGKQFYAIRWLSGDSLIAAMATIKRTKMMMVMKLLYHIKNSFNFSRE